MKLKSIDLIYTLFILSIIYVYFSNFPLNVDSTWMLHGAQQILNGTTLYSELPALNPPLIYMYSTIPVVISKILLLSKESIYVILVLLLIIYSIYLCYKVLFHVNINKPDNLRYYCYAILFILAIAPTKDFGQREHLFIIFTLPYIILMIYRENIAISQKALITISIFATLGFNIKPHFFLIFIGVELAYAFSTKNIKSFFRKDFFIIFFSSFLYLAIIYTFFNEYLTVAIPFALEIYTDTFNKSYQYLITNFDIILALISIIFWFVFSDRKINHSIKSFLFLFVTTILIYLLQKKGWSYHRLPFFLITLLFLTHILFNEIKAKKKIFMIIFVFFIINSLNLNSKQMVFKELEDILASLPKKSKIHIISVDVGRGQSLLVKKDQIWASRFAGLILLNKILKDKDNKKLKEFMFNVLIEDLEKYQTEYIIFCGKYTKFDYYSYFTKESEELKRIYLNNYTKKEIDGYIVLTKRK